MKTFSHEINRGMEDVPSRSPTVQELIEFLSDFPDSYKILGIEENGYVRFAEEARKPKSSNRFRFEYNASCELGADEIWPDGNWPANPTLQDVARIIRNYASSVEVDKEGEAAVIYDEDEAHNLVGEWNLNIGSVVKITEVL